MEFRCRLATATGEIVEGVYVAPSEADLRRELEDKGLHVLALRPRRGLGGLLAGGRPRKVARQEFLVFNQELATLLKAGMPLVQSLDILRQRLANPLFKAVLDDVHQKVRGGTALSDAFGAHGELFPGVYVASLTAGERSGDLVGVLRRFVAYEKVVDAVRRRTLAALMYPAILVGLSVVLVAIIVLRVVPSFSEFYGSFNAELPLVTRIIVAVSDAITGNLPLLLVALAGGAIALSAWMRRPGQRVVFDRWLLRVPRLGAIAHKFATSQLARTLATLLGGGIPLVTSLEIAARSAGNRHLAGELAIVQQRVREGQGFAATLLERQVVPDVAVKMIEVGESTGALQEMLNALADFYDEEIDTEVGRFVTLIEPALLVIMGIVIAGVVLALYMPLFQLNSVLGG
jgi:type IV pilus assembly protein PilC